MTRQSPVVNGKHGSALTECPQADRPDTTTISLDGILENERLLRREAETLNDVARGLVSVLDLKTVLQKVTDAGTLLTGAAFGAFFYNAAKEGDESYLLYTLSGAPEEAFEKFEMPRATPLFEPTFRGEAAIRIADVLQDPRYGQWKPHAGMPPGHLPVRSYLAVPVKSLRGEVLGGLFFGHPKPDIFTEHSERLATGLSAQAAIAIDNARLFEQVTHQLDIRTRAEASLRMSQEQLSRLLALMPSAMYACDADGRITHYNQRAVEIWGREPALNESEQRFCGSFRLWRPDGSLLPHDQTPMAVALREGISIRDEEVVIEQPTGRRLTVSVSIDPLCESDGRRIGAINIFQDATERKLAESALRESEAHYRQLIQCLPEAVYTCDADGYVKLYNDAAAELWGREPEIGKSLWCGPWKVFHSDGTPMPLDQCPMAQTLRTGTAVRGREILIERPDGTRRHLLPHPEPIFDANGILTGAVNMLLDITERKQAERTRSLLSSIVESSDDAIISLTLDGRISSWNAGAKAMYGYSAEEAVGKPVSMLIPPDCHSDETELLQRLKRGEHIEHFETVRLAKDGRRLDVSLTVSPLRDDAGFIIGASKIARDITKRKQARQALRELQERFARFMQHLPGLAWIKDQDGRYVYVNDTAEQAFGVSRSQLYGLRDDEVFPDATAAIFQKNDRLALESGEAVETIETLEHDDGLHSSLVTKFPIPGVNSHQTLVGGIAIDITDRVRAEQALRDSELKFRTVAMNAPVAIFIKDLEGRYVMANPIACRALGRPDGVEGQTDKDLLTPDQARALRQNDLKVLASNISIEAEESVGINGENRHYLSVKFPMTDSTGKAVGVCGVAVDITERKRAEALLRVKEAELEHVSETTPLILTRCSRDLRYLFANRAAAALFGLTPDQMTGKSILEIMGPEAFARIKPNIDKVLNGNLVKFEAEILYKGAGRRWVQATYNPDRNELGEVVGWVASIVDITDRKRAEEALRETEQRFRVMADNAPVLIWVNDRNGCEFVNQAYLQFTGCALEEVLGTQWTSRLHPDDAAEYLNAYDAAEERAAPFEAHVRFRRADGQYRWLHSMGMPRTTFDGACMGYVGCSVDVTDQRRAQEALELQAQLLEDAVMARTTQLQDTNQRLRLAERMASLGTLSAGLGHDMGNLLMPLRVRLESLAKSGLSPQQQEDIDAIGTTAEYLQRLSGGLRMLAMDPHRERTKESTEILSWWSNAEILLKNAVPRNVKVTSRLPQQPCAVGLSRAALTQVVFNLVQNAGYAFLGSAGTVTVWVEPSGDVTRIGVSDDGPGMTEEVRAHCMEPFFTTKTRGISTGLGLPLVYGLVHDADGTVTVESEIGKGATFIITLPTRELTAESHADTAQNARRAYVKIEDRRIQAFIAAELRQLGYDVTLDDSQLCKVDVVVAARLDSMPALPADTRVLIVGNRQESIPTGVVAVLDGHPSPQAIRDALQNLTSLEAKGGAAP